MGFVKDTLTLARKEFFNPIGQGGRVLGFTGRLPDERNYESLIGDGSNSSLVQSCIAWVANVFSLSEPVVLKVNDVGDFESPDRFNPVAQLFRSPTYDPIRGRSFYGWRPFIQATLTSFIVDGNAYWLKVRSKSGRVVQLWYVPHWMMTPWWEIGSDSFIDYYRYTPSFGGPGGTTYAEIAPTEVVHFRDGLDPANTRKGFSKVKTLLREIYSDEEAARWTASLLKNQAVPGLVISPGQGWVAQEDDLKAIKTRVEESTSGDAKGRVIVVSGPTHVEQYGFSPEQMKLEGLRNIPEERVSSLIGIPAAVVGFGTGLEMTKVGATMAELVDLGVLNGVLPRMATFSGEIGEQLFPDFGLDRHANTFNFDISKLQLFADFRNKEADTLEKLMRWSIIQRGEARRRLNLPAGVRDGVYVLSSGLTEVDATKTIEEAPAIKPIVENAPVSAVPGEGAPNAPVGAPAPRAAPTSGKALTPREAEIAALMVKMTNREIADKLVISERTVDTHALSVMAKLGVHSRTEVIV